MEFLVLALVVAAPWGFGCTDAVFEALLYPFLGLLLVLWSVRALVEGSLRWTWCPLTVCLGLLFFCGLWQLKPLAPQALGWLSPATRRLYDETLPRDHEVLVSDQTPKLTQPAPGSTISFYPAGTRAEMIRLLAVLLLFAAVRQNIASTDSLRRLAIAALANGTALALFGIIQFFVSPHNVVYGAILTQGEVFGPFVNRNHFAFYVNLCIGLGVGLLLSSKPVAWREFVHEPRRLWIGAAHKGNAIADDTDVGIDPGIAAAIHHPAIANQDIVLRVLREGVEGEQQENQQEEQFHGQPHKRSKPLYQTFEE